MAILGLVGMLDAFDLNESFTQVARFQYLRRGYQPAAFYDLVLLQHPHCRIREIGVSEVKRCIRCGLELVGFRQLRQCFRHSCGVDAAHTVCGSVVR